MLIEDLLMGMKSDIRLVTSQTPNVTGTSQHNRDYKKCHAKYADQKTKSNENYLRALNNRNKQTVEDTTSIDKTRSAQNLSEFEPITKDQSIIAVYRQQTSNPQNIEELIATLLLECVDKATDTPTLHSSLTKNRPVADTPILDASYCELMLEDGALTSTDNSNICFKLKDAADTTNMTKDMIDISSSVSSNNSKYTVNTDDPMTSVTSNITSNIDQKDVPTESTSNDDIESRSSGTASPLPQDDSDSDSGISSISLDTSPIITGNEDSESTSSCKTSKSPIPVEVIDIMAIEVKYRGHDILDLGNTLTSRPWGLQPTVLPLMNLEMFWQNRSQYHRLGDFGQEQYKQLCCIHCDFQYPVPN